MMNARLVFLSLPVCLLIEAPAGAATTNREPVYAVVVGVNRPLGKHTLRLRYADDDAILFHRLFKSVGDSTLLVSPDDATRRLHGSLHLALAPTRKNLLAALERTFARMEQARERGLKPQFYFVYSGHGDVKNNRGYLALDDTRLTSDDLARLVLARSPAINNHVVVDACRSYYLVQEKRAGGERRPIKGRFHQPESLLRRFPHTGFLLSTSSDENSHEWAEFQAGIFSHEVRSGLLGPADANRDGRVTYDEIWAFVETANRRIPNERYRPTIFMRPPRGDGSRHLLDMRRFRGAAIRVPARQAGRYMLEDRHGVRLADLHTAPGEPVTLWLPRAEGRSEATPRAGAKRPKLPRAEGRSEATPRAGAKRPKLPRAERSSSRLYLHDLKRLVEYKVSLDTGRERVLLAQLGSHPSSYRPKGAAHEAFVEIFEEPFGAEVYRVRMTCEKKRMDATPCPSYYCTYCQCHQCRHVWDDPGMQPGERPAPVVHAKTPPPIQKKGRPRWEPVVHVTMGLRVMYRDFDFNDPLYPAKSDEHSNFRSGFVPAIDLRVALYPLAALHRGPLRNLGLSLRYYRALGLKAQPPTGDRPVDTTLQEWLVGPRFRWNFLDTPRSPEMVFGADFGQLRFVIWDDQYNYVPLPDIVYNVMRLKLVDLGLPLHSGRILRLVARAKLDYHVVFGAGEIENTDSTGYGRASIGAIALAGNLTFDIRGGLVGLEAFYQRYFYDFDNSCYHGKLGCRAAGGATDRYYGFLLFGGYQY
jgi:hypothetical protein